jgi:hypothetical protein
MRRRQSRGGQKEFTFHTVYTMDRISNPEEYIFRLPVLSPKASINQLPRPTPLYHCLFLLHPPGPGSVHFLKILPGDAERSFEGVVCILAP